MMAGGTNVPAELTQVIIVTLLPRSPEVAAQICLAFMSPITRNGL